MNNDETFVILTPGFPKNEADSTCIPMLQQFVLTLKDLYPQINIVVLSFQYPYFKKTYQWFDITVTSFNGRNKGGLSKLFLRKKIDISSASSGSQMHSYKQLQQKYSYIICVSLVRNFNNSSSTHLSKILRLE